ncbi:MAG TPA: TadE/TadG family type IV pilus assembly protein [Candidatus Solibacter sp.]|nr:TadE/TadG family type IV pilus assembly protein [Candidatus Solibacter sp.]
MSPAAALKQLARADSAAQMVEFAVSLPLLMVFVIGIFDFSGAFTLKQKLTNVAREAARASAADPATDIANATVPASVADAFQVVSNYLDANHLSSCGITQSNLAAANLVWSATAPGCPPAAGLSQISINRALATTQVISGTQTKIISTKVTLQYTYAWHFNRIISVLVSNATYASMTTLSASATAINEN